VTLSSTGEDSEVALAFLAAVGLVKNKNMPLESKKEQKNRSKRKKGGFSSDSLNSAFLAVNDILSWDPGFISLQESSTSLITPAAPLSGDSHFYFSAAAGLLFK
jgi:hypothetical protein